MPKIIKNNIEKVQDLKLTAQEFQEIQKKYDDLSNLENSISDCIPNIELYLGGSDVDYNSIDYHTEYFPAEERLPSYNRRIEKITKIEEKIFFKGYKFTQGAVNKALHEDMFLNPSKYQYRFIVIKGILQGIKTLSSIEYKKIRAKEPKHNDVNSLLTIIRSRKLNKKDKALLIKELS